MNLQKYFVETETFKQICPNCSRDKKDFVKCVDKYGRDEIKSGDGHYCSRCGFCFEAAD